MEAREADDPHRDAMAELLADLSTMQDAAGRPLEVVRLPSPGLLLDHEGEILPASYCNFYIANDAVLVPTYGVPSDARAEAVLRQAFPGHEVVMVPADAICAGGGNIHCITQQQPRP